MCIKKGKSTLLPRPKLPWFYVLVYVLFYVFSASRPTQMSFKGMPPGQEVQNGHSLREIVRTCCSLGKHNALSYVCWVFLSYSLLMNVAYSLLLSKPDTMPAEKQKQKSNCFSYFTLPSHHFSGEAPHRGNDLPSLEGKDCSHYPLYAHHVTG